MAPAPRAAALAACAGAAAAASGWAADEADLRRAGTPRPGVGSPVAAASGDGIFRAIDAHLRGAGVPVRPCEDWGHAQLDALLAQLTAHRDARLQELYEARADKRAVGAAPAPAAATNMTRDGACAHAVMLWAHHVPAPARRALRAAAAFAVPLMPAAGPRADGDRLYRERASCVSCHYNGGEAARPAAAGLAARADPQPVWPTAFSANFTETTWYKGGMQHTRGSVSYDWAKHTQVIRRGNSTLNPICNGRRPGRHDPCWQYAAASRWLIWPQRRECCLAYHANGVLDPAWVTAVPNYYTGKRDIGGAACRTWYLHSGTPDRVATAVGPGVDGRLCELYDGGADGTDDNPFSWAVDQSTYRDAPSADELALPDYCAGAEKC